MNEFLDKQFRYFCRGVAIVALLFTLIVMIVCKIFFKGYEYVDYYFDEYNKKLTSNKNK